MEGVGLVKIPRVGATLLNVFPWTLSEERGVGRSQLGFVGIVAFILVIALELIFF